MIAYLLSPTGRLDRRAYVIPVATFYGLSIVIALATGSRLSWSSAGSVLDNPWGVIGRGLDASLLNALPFALALPLGVAVMALGIWACFALTIKRLRDFDHSAWWSALLLIPGLALILMIVCALTPGSRAVARLQTNPI